MGKLYELYAPATEPPKCCYLCQLAFEPIQVQGSTPLRWSNICWSCMFGFEYDAGDEHRDPPPQLVTLTQNIEALKRIGEALKGLSKNQRAAVLRAAYKISVE